MDKAHPLRQPAALFVGSAASILITSRLFGWGNNLADVWPATAVQLSLLLPRWPASRSARLLCHVSMFLGIFLGGVARGFPGGLSLSIALLNQLELWLAVLLFNGELGTFDDLKRLSKLLRFGVVSVIAPLICSLVAILPVVVFLHLPWLHALEVSFLADSLGFVIVLPPALFLRNGEFKNLSKLRPHLRQALPALACFSLCLAYVFQQTSNPVLWIIFPSVVWVVLLLGLEGAVLTLLATAVFGSYATLHGHGALTLAASPDPSHIMILLQSFLWISAASSLPIGALLDERKRAERELNQSWAVYETILQNADDLMIHSSLDGSRRFASAAVERFTGWRAEEFIQLDRRSTVHPEDWKMAELVMNSMLSGKLEHRFRYRLMHKDGTCRWVDASARVYMDQDGTVRGYVSTVRDISTFTASESAWNSERSTLQQENQKLSALAHTDALTGLLNRRGFENTLRSCVECSSVALLLLDVDFFKFFNDTYGHPAGDECLRHIASLLEGVACRNEDVLARIGGEEFALLLPNGDGDTAEIVAERILSQLQECSLAHRTSPFERVTISIGISIWRPLLGEEFQQQLQRADRALYTSKKQGRNRFTQTADLDEALPIAI